MLLMKDENRQQGKVDMFTDQRVLVLGLGKTGLSCVRFLADNNVDFAVMDSRTNPPGFEVMQTSYPSVKCYFGGFAQEVMDDFDVLIVSPGVSLKTPAVQKATQSGKLITGDIDIFAACINKPVVAITGSNGKSTVTTLVGEMAKQAKINVAVGGNIGVPVLDLLMFQKDADLFVLELSSFQLETTQHLNAAASTILNISEDHMDRYDSLAEYAQAKHRIYFGDGKIVLNKDEPIDAEMLRDRNVVAFGLSTPQDQTEFGLIDDGEQVWLAKGEQRLLPESMLKIKGRHNVANALAALALGECVDIPMQAMLTTLQSFGGLPHRTQWVIEHNGVNWFNDSKATNVGATIAAVRGFGGKQLIVLLGGQGKGQDFSPLKPVLEEHCKAALIYGEDAGLIEKAISGDVNIVRVKDLQQAVSTANELAVSGDIVLLSPACASFDMFNGYDHRGDEFARMAREVNS